jgi:serine/tyrosine/threonine adenylyltransferase
MSIASQKSIGRVLTNTYSELSPAFFTLQDPAPVKAPGIVLFNENLALSLGLDTSHLSEEELAAFLSGNNIPQGGKPLAQAYAGHQFGHFNMLGDGRAVLLGEIETPDDKRVDLQLKGSGKTRYSRGGDGRATLKSMLREYLISEAMHGLGIPTSRSLAVVTTGQPVIRETVQPGAILARIAASHIRVGTVEFARQFLEIDQQKQLLNYILKRHYPAHTDTSNPALALIQEVMERQAYLIAEWMRVGFIHGVMNTDNMSLSGETIDYGPCAFVNAYHPDTVFSSIDTQGRYAFANQPIIAHWNLSCLAGSLLPLIHPEQDKAVQLAQEQLNRFPVIYSAHWLKMMRNKLGWEGEEEEDEKLINALLTWMQDRRADYTNTFSGIQQGDFSMEENLADHEFQTWFQKWKERATRKGRSISDARNSMRKFNPVYIPRNHQVELALSIAADHGDFGKFNEFLHLLQNPYTPDPARQEYLSPPEDNDMGYKTYCGT